VRYNKIVNAQVQDAAPLKIAVSAFGAKARRHVEEPTRKHSIITPESARQAVPEEG
jgi:hypothetical protein